MQITSCNKPDDVDEIERFVATIVDNLQQADKIDNLQQVCCVFGLCMHTCSYSYGS